jgi:hypothetical protein
MGIRDLLRLVALTATLQGFTQGLAVQANTVDGFVASCTGNLDGTGECLNAETGSRYACLIIPGQVIDCRSNSSRTFQCVWISGAQANYAEFWCDSQIDAMLRNELSSKQLRQPFTNTTPNHLRFIEGNELTDPFRSKDEDSLKDDFGNPLNAAPSEPDFGD